MGHPPPERTSALEEKARRALSDMLLTDLCLMLTPMQLAQAAVVLAANDLKLPLPAWDAPTPSPSAAAAAAVSEGRVSESVELEEGEEDERQPSSKSLPVAAAASAAPGTPPILISKAALSSLLSEVMRSRAAEASCKADMVQQVGRLTALGEPMVLPVAAGAPAGAAAGGALG